MRSVWVVIRALSDGRDVRKSQLDCIPRLCNDVVIVYIVKGATSRVQVFSSGNG